MAPKPRLFTLREFVSAYSAQTAGQTVILGLEDKDSPGSRIVTPQEALPIIYKVLDEDLEGWPLVNTSGEVVVADIALINNQTRYMQFLSENGNPLAWTAAGVISSIGVGLPWVPIGPVTVTADGAGNPPATVFQGLAAGDLIDVMIYMENDLVAGAGEYIHRFRTDPLGAVGGIAAVDPAWAATVIPMPANGSSPRSNPYGHRMITTAVASAFGIADGVNGDWPANANVTYTGFYRYI